MYCQVSVFFDMKEKEKNTGLSESFITGIIAMIFLIVGYQTALFVHRAAVMKVVADRDDPDTVFVYQMTSDTSGLAVGKDIEKDKIAGKETMVRKNSEHHYRAEAVRTNASRKNIESFRFDPNTVSVEDLCRLGFTPKQAQSIDNYRNKGGRFRRKTDFAKSFVVSDSVYSLLEPYIDIPLIDLNLADSATLDALPGIGGWYAIKIIEYRERLGGYSYKEQLMDISRFDQEKFNALEDLISVSREHQTPYQLWTLPADSLMRHPYIGNYETACAIVLYRENTPKSQWTVDALSSAGVLSQDSASMLAGCLIACP